MLAVRRRTDAREQVKVTEEEHREFSEQEVQQRFDAIGKNLVEAGLYAEAVEAYKQLIRDYPASRWAANAYLGIAHCYHAMGQEEEELAALEDIIAQFPDHVVAKRARGAIAALRERRSGEGPAGSDLHAAVRRLTRQVERMREGERRRTWLGIAVYVALVIFFRRVMRLDLVGAALLAGAGMLSGNHFALTSVWPQNLTICLVPLAMLLIGLAPETKGKPLPD
jgi:tetratricopeptide (TPR) repeat protein